MKIIKKPINPKVSCWPAFLVFSGLPTEVNIEKPAPMMIKNRIKPAMVKM